MASRKYAGFKRKLEEQKERLRRDLETAQETAPSGVTSADEPSYSNHLADEATATYQQEANLALERHLERELAGVDAALQRLQNGTYGRCENCGGEIGLERLEALPTATLCINCKSRQENRK
ncbi:MAG: TraR/DksA C4-type zinc finger protein [Chloroflexi bacterium]|nr:TraR/DksA C4-type zinc finger protein [Chloroflexota bacterium]MCL5110897.1 TraR/DksA C4-type zinc finger protein [Chloroflexota bacterium]